MLRLGDGIPEASDSRHPDGCSDMGRQLVGSFGDSRSSSGRRSRPGIPLLCPSALKTGVPGRARAAWGSYLPWHKAVEARFTVGRHCKAFRAVAGLADSSDDGSSGIVAVRAEDVEVYRSATLVPGMQRAVQVPLRLPYRFTMQAFDTSPDSVDGRPMFGDPELLCTAVDG